MILFKFCVYVLLVASVIAIRLYDPELTESLHFLKYWWFYLFLIICTFVVQYAVEYIELILKRGGKDE